MAIGWRDSRELLIDLLGRHGLVPDRIGDVGTAWTAFREFLAQPVDGLDPAPDGDVDGFIVQWGRYGWNDKLPSLTFTRQFAVDARNTWEEADGYQPEYWQVSLDMVFPDAPALADISELNVQDTGFDFSPPGPERDHAIGEAEWEIRLYPTLHALWTSVPVRSSVTLDRAD